MSINIQDITDADVIAWANQKCRDSGISVSIELLIIAGPARPDYYSKFILQVSDNVTTSGSGQTFNEAAKELKSKVKTPADLAAKKRAEAAKMLAEADALDPQQTTALPT